MITVPALAVIVCDDTANVHSSLPSVIASSTLPNFPWPQFLQLVLLNSFWYVPNVHTSQAAEPVPDALLPAAQSVQEVSLSKLCDFPSAQGTQDVCPAVG